MTISCSSSFSPSTSAWTSTLVRSSVGFSRRSAISFWQRSKISGMSFAMTRLDALGVEVGVAGAERRVHQPRPDRVVLGRDAHEAADDARDDRLRDVVDEVARLAALEPVEHVARRSSRISSSWSAIRFGVKPRWNSALTRSCFGGSIPMNIAALQLEREDARSPR